MKKSRIRVLLVEDDPTQGKALLEAFTRAGYQATLVTSSVKGLTLAQREEFHCLIADCMLPKMNGVDLAEEIVQNALTAPPKIFLFSGIYKTQRFIREATDRTGALAFFTKPLDLEEVLREVANAVGSPTDTDKIISPLLELYSGEEMPGERVLKLIEKESTIHCIHFPMLLKRIQKSRLTGDLTLISSVGDVSAVSFFNGDVFAVRTPDKDSYFGGLAVGFGFVSPEDVLAALRNSTGGKLLGQKLIESFSLSPHAINLILEEQLALRLSQTLRNGVVSLQWINKSFPTPEYSLRPHRLEELAVDWTRSKIESTWVKSAFAIWGDHGIQGHYHPHINSANSIDQLFSHADFVENQDLTYFFRQLINGNATLGSRTGDERNWTFLERRLDQLLSDFKDMNYFQILGVGEKAKSLELNKAFNDLKGYYDPKELGPGCPPAILVKCTKVFQYIETAYKTLGDDKTRERYFRQEQSKRGQRLLESEPVFRAAIHELLAGDAKEAAKKFQGLLDQKLEFKDLRSYRIWAGLRGNKHFSSLTLDQVPPEERHSAPYMMAKGVYYRSRGHLQKALEAFRTAHVLDPHMTIARSELEELKKDIERRGNRVLLKEVTSIVEGLLGRSRRGA